MSRHAAREIVLHMIFLNDYSGGDGQSLLAQTLTTERFEELAAEYKLYAKFPEKSQMEYITQAVCGVCEKRELLDEFIAKYSVGWQLSRISRVTRCILRLCMLETKFMDIPVKASVNEALEFAKLYDGPEAAQFINGIMGSFIADEVENADS